MVAPPRKSSGPPLTKRERSDATRTRLLDAAVKAFAEHGFHGTSTRDIAVAAGMSPAGVYIHYKSKEELLYRISRRGHDNSRRLMEVALAASDDPAEQLAEFMRSFALDHARNHTQGRVVNSEFEALNPQHRTEIRRIRAEIERGVCGIVESGTRSGVFTTADPEKAAVALLSLSIDIARWYHDEGRWRPEDVAEFYADLALKMVGVRREA
jgi:AcrR family transcriptional regulator